MLPIHLVLHDELMCRTKIIDFFPYCCLPPYLSNHSRKVDLPNVFHGFDLPHTRRSFPVTTARSRTSVSPTSRTTRSTPSSLTAATRCMPDTGRGDGGSLYSSNFEQNCVDMEFSTRRDNPFSWKSKDSPGAYYCGRRDWSS